MSNDSDLQRLLREADPIAREGGLAVDAAASIRRTALDAVARPEPALSRSPSPFFVAATVAATLLMGVASGRALRSHEADVLQTRMDASRAALVSPRQQLQFATPGGTRIIWVFDPEFNP